MAKREIENFRTDSALEGIPLPMQLENSVLIFAMKESIIDGCYDEDLYQELSITLLKCIRQFSI